MSNYIKSIRFALATAVICSFLLTAASTGLKRFQLENIDSDKKKNILKAVGLVDDELAYTKEDIMDIYEKNIQGYQVTSAGEIITRKEPSEKLLPIYIYVKDKKVMSYILPIDTRGLWGKIFGYLALNKDGSTVTGLTVYKHSETPGLGGEIEKRWFQKNFKGKKVVDINGNFVSISIAKGFLSDSFPQDKRPNYVDGISGATLTGRFLTAGLKEILLDYEPVSIKFRNNQRIGIQEE